MKNDDQRPGVDTGRLGDRPADDGGLVERLLHAAGPGPEVPADGADRVKELIRPQWREGASVHARQRRLLWAGGHPTKLPPGSDRGARHLAGTANGCRNRRALARLSRRVS